MAGRGEDGVKKQLSAQSPQFFTPGIGGFRSRATLDVFGNSDTRLIAGYNRYYGAALLTYKLREARTPYYREYRTTEHNIVTDWVRDSGQGDYRYVFDGVKTPYSDEQTLGLSQSLLGGVMTLKLVKRDNRNEFARTTTETQEDGYRYYLMNMKSAKPPCCLMWVWITGYR